MLTRMPLSEKRLDYQLPQRRSSKTSPAPCPMKHHSIKRKKPVPDTPYTKYHKLDSTILSKLPKPAKDTNWASIGIQTLVLDVACSLINMLESARKGTLNTKETAESAQQALKLLGNASANISRERRQKATQHLNLELATLVDNEESFKDTAAMLFGETFDQRAKGHIDPIRSLKKTSSLPRDSLFRGATPQCPEEVATEVAEEHSRNLATSRPGENSMNVFCTKNLMNVVNYTDVHSKSTNKVQSMCQV